MDLAPVQLHFVQFSWLPCRAPAWHTRRCGFSALLALVASGRGWWATDAALEGRLHLVQEGSSCEGLLEQVWQAGGSVPAEPPLPAGALYLQQGSDAQGEAVRAQRRQGPLCLPRQRGRGLPSPRPRRRGRGDEGAACGGSANPEARPPEGRRHIGRVFGRRHIARPALALRFLQGSLDRGRRRRGAPSPGPAMSEAYGEEGSPGGWPGCGRRSSSSALSPWRAVPQASVSARRGGGQGRSRGWGVLGGGGGALLGSPHGRGGGRRSSSSSSSSLCAGAALRTLPCPALRCSPRPRRRSPARKGSCCWLTGGGVSPSPPLLLLLLPARPEIVPPRLCAAVGCLDRSPGQPLLPVPTSAAAAALSPSLSPQISSSSSS